MSTDRVVIVGASHAGAQLAANLRKEKWAGDILLIGDEGRLPYQRPPLSKAYLAGDCHLDDVAIRSHQFYDKQRIQLVDGTVTSIDRAERTVTLGNNDAVSYSKLALCTGARARALPVPGADLPGVHYLRTATDVEAIRAAAVPGSRVVIVGGGYIGLETAASLRTLGVEVTVLEAAGRVLERVTAPVVSEFFDRIHREKGVDVRIDAIVEGFRGDKRVASVVLAGGETLAADLVIVGVGVIPNTELAAAAGIDVENGILVDDRARSSDPDIVAAGDCANHRIERYGRRVRLECVSATTEHAKIAAATICDNTTGRAALPWFWSDQYDLKLQIAGLNTGYDEVLVSGDPAHGRDFTCYYFSAGELIAADCVNRPADFVNAKRAIAQRAPIVRSALIGATP
ncbi:pyridine nucleotide-disulfide oxidoreductase [Tsukamurella pulmonis]|uniref:FAD-dependent oxidoreductase n=13 Tax=Tsukamurella TaxID=2060 RepID=A0ABS5NHL3_TSUPA|nr:MULTISPECIES: FAD-dependent oxidoreductase [Tsukamurella]KXO87502.1 pyridine nucleotide-disulfide oxidoreductase [Tsukamurella pulmonis]KXP01932.1 pyridine nucleotide-disulfide oxidoreductase [Tsukamurella tyrosinosolvens]KXP08335.1 pyridine nucleotide-disulfide oxidoreductase [Tsukamurella pulmonis]KZL95197.1 pyridine nucleotide-disulfide oxidoreductase [Tsukamurella tyrosinosolvens]MBS4103784.1 FAD-dependent oxidoreductase [Tsukamurella paurometabola]